MEPTRNLNVDIDEAIRQRLEACGPGRRDRALAVCELWFAEFGTPIQLAKLRDYVGRGSMTDLSKDLREFSAVVAQRHRHMLSLPGTPPAFVAALEEAGKSLWVAAMEASTAQFEAQRAELQTEAAKVREEIAAANQQRDLALADRDDMIRQRDAAAGRAADFEREVLALQAAAAADRDQISSLERTAFGLQRDLEAERNARDQERTRAALDIEEIREVARASERSAQRADDRVKAAEKKLADDATLIDGFRNRATAAEKATAELRGRLEALQEQLTSAVAVAKDADVLRARLADLQSRNQSTEASRDQAITQAALLQRDLESATDKFSVAVEDNASLSHQVTTLTAAVEQKSKTIEALHAKVTDLESRTGGLP